MAILYKYRIRCTTDNKYEHIWLEDSDPAPTVCPVDPGHTIDPAQTAVVEVSGSQQQVNSDNVMLTQPQVQTVGWQICDRDVKLVTCTMDANAAIEDLKVDMVTLKEVPWNECSLVGVYKDGGANMVACTDQADADANGILSVFDYLAKDQTTGDPIQYDIRDGGLIVDPDLYDILLVGERYLHRAYAVGAPDLHGIASHVRFFDGYLSVQPDHQVEAKSPQAKRMDPDAAPGLEPAPAVLRVFIYHPAGAKRTHVLRLVTYRALGTF